MNEKNTEQEKKSILNKSYIITMPNGDEYSIPIHIIALNRAKNYAIEFEGDIQKSLIEDTIPLFESDPYNISDWAKNNMNWDEVEEYAILHKPKKLSKEEFQECWVNGEYKIE